MDAIETPQGKIYHASCHDEVEKSKAKEKEGMNKKRKAEVSFYDLPTPKGGWVGMVKKVKTDLRL
jgi:hypothetical protein